MSDEAAVRRFYDEVWPLMPAVLRTARLLSRDEADAEDLAQEAMVKAFRSIGRFEAGTDARAWVMTILRNARVDRLRSRGREAGQVSVEELAEDPPAPPETEAGGPERWADPAAMLASFSDAEVITALRQLPEDMRWTLLLVDVEGLDLAEAAEVMGVAVGTVKSRTHRARAMLRGKLAAGLDAGRADARKP